jgi:hypothetical protein
LINEIAQLIREGNYIETTCRVVGISSQSYRTWKKRGAESRSGIYRRFYEAIDQSEAKAESTYLGIIKDAANGKTWQAAAWYLERRYPDRWGRRQFTDITSGGKPLQKIDATQLTDDELETIEKLFTLPTGKASDTAGSAGGEGEA